MKENQQNFLLKGIKLRQINVRIQFLIRKSNLIKKLTEIFNTMIRNTFILTSLCSLPMFNEFVKSQVHKTNTFKQTISQIQHQLKQINISLSSRLAKDQSKYTGEQASSSQPEVLFELILIPEIEKLLSKKSKNRIQLIRKLKQGQNSSILLNAWVGSVNLLGSFVYMPFFYYSTIAYALFSQLSLINDLYTIKTGKKLANLPYTTISQLYLKVSSVVLLAFSMKAGFRKLASMTQSKEIVKKGD